MKAVQMKPRRRAAGFTLIELMFAIAVIAIALFAISSMVLQSVALREAGRESETAREWVQKKIEEVKSRSFAELKTTAYAPAGGSNLYSTTFAGSTVPSGLNGAVGIMTIDYSNSKLYEIVVRIDWKGTRGKSTYSLRSLYAE